MAKHTQFVGNLPTNCLSVFGHFMGLTLIGLTTSSTKRLVKSNAMWNDTFFLLDDKTDHKIFKTFQFSYGILCCFITLKNIVLLLKLADVYMTILSKVFLITTVIVNLYWQRYVTWPFGVAVMRHCGVVIINTAKLHSTRPKLRFSTSSNPAYDMSKICGGEDLWPWSLLEMRLHAFRKSTIPHKKIHHIVTTSKLNDTTSSICFYKEMLISKNNKICAS